VAIISNTYQTYQAKGLREQLADTISNISPTETPFQSNAGRGKVKGTYNEWQTDSLASPDSANKQIEGDDVAAFDAVSPTVRVGNWTQISRKTLIVADTEEVVDKAGRDSEEAFQIAKKGLELKRDIETMILSNLAGSAGATGTARASGSLLSHVKTNQNIGASGAAPTYTTQPTGTRTDGTQRAFTETILKDVLTQCWTNGADPSTVMLGGAQKGVASTFSGVATKYNVAAGTKQATVIGAVDVYVGDFSVVRFVPNRFQRNRDAWVLDFEYLSVDYLRPIKKVALAKTGDASKSMLIGEWMLRVKNEAAEGIAADLT
jgi:hypothetical protein